MSNYAELAHCKATLQEMERDLAVVEARIPSAAAVASVDAARTHLRGAIDDLWTAMQETVDPASHASKMAHVA